MSAPHRKVVNFTLKMENFVTCLIWEGKRFHKSIVRWKKESLNLPPVGLILHFMRVFVNIIYYSGSLTCLSYLLSLYKSEMLW